MKWHRDRKPIAWILNLDAENELEAGARYAPTQRMQRIVAEQSPRLRNELVAPGDIVLDRDCIRPGEAEGFDGRAWSPTLGARNALQLAGAELGETPSMEILQRVNARPFTATMRESLRGDAFSKRIAVNLDEALLYLSEPATLGWLVRRSFGAAGRGRRRIAAGRIAPSDQAWLVASLRRGALVIEPYVEIVCEYTRSGWVKEDGGVVVSRPCLQTVNSAGAWTRSDATSLREIARADDLRLDEACALAGVALAKEGYRGPYGIDSFSYREGANGRSVLNPLSEINARFTMDWATAMTERPERE
jgi:hypothetical protein